MKKILFCLILLLALTTYANAFTVTQSGAIVHANYVEPSTNTDGSLLDDLDHISIYYNAGQGDIKALDVPATAPSGGSSMSADVTVPIKDGQQANVDFWATAVDTSGNESAPSPKTTLRIDRLAPSAPK